MDDSAAAFTDGQHDAVAVAAVAAAMRSLDHVALIHVGGAEPADVQVARAAVAAVRRADAGET